MSSVPKLPVELLSRIFAHLSKPKDLFHVASTCKEFHRIIVSTYHLRFLSISCSFIDTPTLFWKKLASTRLCSTIRQLEICNNCLCYGEEFFTVHPRNALWSRIDWSFKILDFFKSIDPAWRTTAFESKDDGGEADFETILQCLSNLRRCQYIDVYEMLSSKECNDLLTCIAVHLSDILQTLVIHMYVYGSGTSTPNYTLTNCSFSRLITFHFHLNLYDNLPDAALKLVLDSLVFKCSTLVNFTLNLNYLENAISPSVFVYLPLVKHANWPSLKKLELGGSLRLFDARAGSATDVYVAFLKRHSQLERLRLVFKDEDCLPFQTELAPHVLPRLRSLSTTFPMHPSILPRPRHIMNLQVFGHHTYALASSLRSCIVTVTSPSTIKDIIESSPDLERLCLIMGPCTGACPTNDETRCMCLLSCNPYEIKRLYNLTHLGILTDDTSSTTIDNLLEDLVGYLPKLSHIHLHDEKGHLPFLYEVLRDSNGSYRLLNSLDYKNINSDWKEDFFYRMMG